MGEAAAGRHVHSVWGGSGTPRRSIDEPGQDHGTPDADGHRVQETVYDDWDHITPFNVETDKSGAEYQPQIDKFVQMMYEAQWGNLLMQTGIAGD